MISRQLFGHTGHLSSRVIFGAAAFSRVNQDAADRALEVLLEHGVNHIDTAARYGDSELRIGKWMARHRQDFFLATKTRERGYQAAWDDLRRSLDRLQVDAVDLWQFHNLVDAQEWEIAMGPDGALAAAVEAKEQGLIRFIGVTGHGLPIPSMHLRSLERFDFDSVLLPYNVTMLRTPHYAADVTALLKVCTDRGVAVQTIKSLAVGPWDGPPTHSTWYEPLEEQADIDTAVHWVLGCPDVFLNTTGDIHILPCVLEAAGRFERRPSEEEIQAAVDRCGMVALFTEERSGP